MPRCATASGSSCGPRFGELMFPTRDDLTKDVDAKYNPDKYQDIDKGPLPERPRPPAHPPQLFDLKTDPFERIDLAASHQDRVIRMTNELAGWFEEVEFDRRRALSSIS